MATREALVPFLDDACISVAYDLSSDVVIILDGQIIDISDKILNEKGV